jgi:hypothetical protein
MPARRKLQRNWLRRDDESNPAADQSADDTAANLDPDHCSLYNRQYPRQHRPQWRLATLPAALG